MTFTEWSKKNWKEIVAIIIGGTALAAGGTLLNLGKGTPDNIPTINVEGKTISFPNYDASSSDNLVIRTDSQFYAPVIGNGIIVYAMVENKSGSPQTGNFETYFTSNEFDIQKISIAASGTYSVVIDDYATGTNATGTYTYNTGTHKEQITGNVWQDIPAVSFTPSKVTNVLGPSAGLIRTFPKQTAGKQISASLPAGGTVYLKIEILLPHRKLNDEFSLEAVGSNSGYGQLDPTILTEDFNSYTDGALQGQGGWTNDAGNVFQIQQSIVYEGLKAAMFNLNTNNGINIYKSGTSLSSGSSSWYISYSATSNVLVDTDLNAAGVGTTTPSLNWICFVGMGFNAGGNPIFKYLGNNAAAWLDIPNATWTTGVWYNIQLQWRSSDHQCQARITGSSIDITTGWTIANITTWTAADTFLMFSQNNATVGVGTSAWDYIAAGPYSTSSTGFPIVSIRNNVNIRNNIILK